MKKKLVISAVFILVSGVVIVISYLIFSVSGEIPQQIISLLETPLVGFSVSVATSVIASLLFLFFQEKFLHTKQDDAVERISMAADVLEDMQTQGILEIKSRSDYEMKYWKNFVKSASGKLIIAGKTLYRWINEEDLKIIFRESIVKKVNEGCEVVFIIYKYEKLDSNDQKEYAKFKKFLNEEVFPRIYNEDKIDNTDFSIKEVDSLPYLYLTNGIEALAMPYFAHVSNDSNLAYRMDSDNKISNIYRDDFDYIIHTSRDNEWINNYKSLHKIKEKE